MELSYILIWIVKRPFKRTWAKAKKDRPKLERPSNQTNYFMKTLLNYFTAISLD
nr:hypothetical protein [Mucilaginibacter sp. FT3.2]